MFVARSTIFLIQLTYIYLFFQLHTTNHSISSHLRWSGFGTMDETFQFEPFFSVSHRSSLFGIMWRKHRNVEWICSTQRSVRQCGLFIGKRARTFGIEVWNWRPIRGVALRSRVPCGTSRYGDVWSCLSTYRYVFFHSDIALHIFF